MYFRHILYVLQRRISQRKTLRSMNFSFLHVALLLKLIILLVLFLVMVELGEKSMTSISSTK